METSGFRTLFTASGENPIDGLRVASSEASPGPWDPMSFHLGRCALVRAQSPAPRPEPSVAEREASVPGGTVAGEPWVENPTLASADREARRASSQSDRRRFAENPPGLGDDAQETA